MNAVRLRQAVSIVVNGEETPGLIVYGIRQRNLDRPVEFPAKAWIGQPVPTNFVLQGENWEILAWEVPIFQWPSAAELQSAARVTMGSLLSAGCPVAWIGAEGLPFCDPPDLFSRECMSGGVLAWSMATGEGHVPLDPDATVSPVPDREMEHLRSALAGLADAT